MTQTRHTETSQTERIIAVFGGSGVPEGTPVYEDTRRLGRLLAQAGYAVMNGGYYGTMAAVSQGAHQAGGRVIGVTVPLFNLQPNPWLDEERRMDAYLPRLIHLTTVPDGYVAVQGGIGTLTEVSVVWSLLQTGSIPRRPFILLGEHWTRILDVYRRETTMKESDLALAQVVATPEEAVDILRRQLR
ncbi:MAG: LOG family protein [Anaerolineae bacterium]|nr:LOG family protein [Anaerolineae bacterium]